MKWNLFILQDTRSYPITNKITKTTGAFDRQSMETLVLFKLHAGLNCTFMSDFNNVHKVDSA